MLTLLSLTLCATASTPLALGQLSPPPVGIEAAPTGAMSTASTGSARLWVQTDRPEAGVLLYRAPARPSGRLTLGLSVPTGSIALCAAPCEVNVDPASESFFLGGEGMPISEVFRVPEGAQAWRVFADPGNSARQLAGTGMLAAAGVVASYSALLLAQVLLIQAAGGGGLAEVNAVAMVGLAASVALGGGGVALIMSGRTLYASGPGQER